MVDPDENTLGADLLSDAINEGYNSLVIYGECIEAIGVYRLNPEVFGMNYSDMPNKPTSFLMIEGASDGTGIISRPTNSNFDFFIKDNSFVQLSEITINHQKRNRFIRHI